MKLSFTTLGCPDWSFDKILNEAERLGFEAIEIRGVDGKMRAEEIPLFFPENLEETHRYIDSHHLNITGFGTSVSFHDEAKYDAAIEEGKAAVDVCSRAGIPAIRVFGDKVESEEVRPGVISRAISGISTLCEYAQGKKVDILLEVHGNFNTIENVMDVTNGVKDFSNYGILWDIEHSDKTYADNWQGFYEAIKPYIKHTHIKDHKRDNGAFNLCLVGEGDIPIADIVRTLRADGYDGYYSLEWEKKWHPELPEPDIALPGYMDYMKKI